MKLAQCSICFEAWPISASRKNLNNFEYKCTRCKRDKKLPSKFGIDNKMIPSKLPCPLKDLTQVEEMLISRAFPVMQIYTKPRGGQVAYKGHVITLPNDVQKVADVLPRHPSDIPVIIFKFKGRNDNSKELLVRRNKVLNALLWLTGTNENNESNNFLYKDIVIDYNIIERLPENDYLSEANSVYFDEKLSGEGSEEEENEEQGEEEILPDLGPINSEDKVYDKFTEMGSFLPGNVNCNKEKVTVDNDILNPGAHEITLGSELFNEFNTEYLASLCFPTLFPDTKGDTTNSSTVRNISNSNCETESFSEKIKHLIKFCEKIDNKWVYRFASHPRFAFWAYNILYRRRLLGQGNYYIKQNPGDTKMTLEELQNMVRTGSFDCVMKKLMRYTKNVTGTNAYWNDAKGKLKATINQVGAPTIFWTLSCAEFHWPEFYSLFSDNEVLDPEICRKNIICNPHLLDWFFTVRVEKFVKHWLYEKLGAT